MSGPAMTGAEAVGLALIAGGAVFFVAGTVGMLRFPDAVSRLHALTKADTVGLALVVLGAAVMAGTAGAALRLGLIWICVALAGALGAQLIAAHVRRAGPPPSDTPAPGPTPSGPTQPTPLHGTGP